MATGRKEVWAEEITRAQQLEPDFPDFRVAAASVAFYRNDYLRVIDLLKDVNPADISSVRYQALRWALLGKAYRSLKATDPQKSDRRLYLLQKEYPPLKKWVAAFFKRLK
ncbi:MAG: hypothetical protein ACM3X9_12990 [Bacillota bacterium]